MLIISPLRLVRPSLLWDDACNSLFSEFSSLSGPGPTHTPHHVSVPSKQSLHPATTSQPFPQPVYSYIRNCTGIVGSRTSPSPSAGFLLMGMRANEYFSAHGYLPGTVRLIQKLYEEANDMNTFVDRLSGEGVPITEARYMYTLIHSD